MNADRSMTTTVARGPAHPRMKIFSLLGATLLVTCLIAGFAQAADNSNELQDNGNFANGIALVSGQAQGLADSEDSGEYCGEHSIRCLDRNLNVLGSINNAPCWLRERFTCEDNPRTDYYRCQKKYPSTEYVQRTSACEW